MNGTMKLITVKDVLQMTGYKSRSTFWRRVRSEDFPRPIALSRHATRWKSSEVEAWINTLTELSYLDEGQVTRRSAS